MTSFVFSFGFGQTHPITGEKLNNRFVENSAATWDEATVKMRERFGQSWGMQYASRQLAGVERYELRPLTGEDALGWLQGTSERERRCSACPCMARRVSRADHGPEAPTCSCFCHDVDDECSTCGDQVSPLSDGRCARCLTAAKHESESAS